MCPGEGCLSQRGSPLWSVLQIHETIESIHQLKIQRDFMLSFSRDPKGYIQDLLRSQSRDLKVGHPPRTGVPSRDGIPRAAGRCYAWTGGGEPMAGVLEAALRALSVGTFAIAASSRSTGPPPPPGTKESEAAD